MARGWESKSVEDQMANALQQPEVDAGNEIVSEEVRRATEQHRTDKERQKQALHLQKESILSQKTWHPARRAALADALAQIESQIEALQ
jgi:uncharacterized membrane protein